ncbi:MAG: carboxypeptidase-like regulatory domain-containing protein [Pseudomonas sp.]
MRQCALILCSAAGLLSAGAASAQSIIGQVLDETTGTPVTAAEVVLLDRSGGARGQSLADSAGWFRLAAPVPGHYRVRASSLGYARIETTEFNLEKGVELHLEVRLSSAAVPHEPLRIVARRPYRVGRLSEYYDRATWTRRTGLGRVYMRDDIERISPFDVSQIIRMVPTRVGCQMTYMLDGLEIDLDALNSLIRPEEVEGIEIYRGVTQIPIEYTHRAGCGLVLVWTRTDPPGMRPFTWKRVLFGAGLAALLFGLASRMHN